MLRFIAVLIPFLLLFCSLASWQVVKCYEVRCGDKSRVECSSKRECSKPSPQKNGCGKNKDTPTPCCVCVGNGCYYLLPVNGFQLRSFPDEAREKPLRRQHLFPQSFHPSIWHPPAPAAVWTAQSQTTISTHFKISTT